MKRDMELVRQILLEVEEKGGAGAIVRLEIPGYSQEELHYHVKMMADANPPLLTAKQHFPTGSGPQAFPISLTWYGHDFLDDARNATVWNASKKKIGEGLTSVSLEVFKAVLVNSAKSLLGLPGG